MKINDNINRLLLLLICLGTLLCCLPFAASANESEENIWGDIKWSTDGDTLTISPVNGTAAMPDAESYNKTPWYSYRRDLITVVINEGITHIGDYAFYGFENIRTVCDSAYANSKGYNFYILKYPSTLKSFGKAAFENCSALYDIVFPNRLYALIRRGNTGLRVQRLCKACQNHNTAEPKRKGQSPGRNKQNRQSCLFWLRKAGFALPNIEDSV